MTPEFSRPYSYEITRPRTDPYGPSTRRDWSLNQEGQDWFLLVMLLLLLSDDDLPEISSVMLAQFDFVWAARQFRNEVGEAPLQFDRFLNSLKRAQGQLFTSRESR